MENTSNPTGNKPFLFEFLEELQISSSASTYTNLGITGVGSGAKQDSDDE